MSFDLILSGAVYGLLTACLLAYVLEVRYRYFSEQVYQARTQLVDGNSETQLSGWIDSLERQVNAEFAPIAVAAEPSVEDLAQTTQQPFSSLRIPIAQTRI